MNVCKCPARRPDRQQHFSGKHGGNVYQIARQTGIGWEHLIDFSANINPLGFSSQVRKVLRSSEDAMLNYPDRESHDFVAALSAYHDMPADALLAGNGSSEFIYLLPRVLRPKSILIVAPAFTEYEASYQRTKNVVCFFATRERDGFAMRTKRLFAELRRGYGALYLCNPANPTGMLVAADTLHEIVHYASQKGTSTVIDETFVDFVEKHSIKKLVSSFDSLFVLRSMTKFFALPGLRLGYLISQPANIDQVRRHQAPWSCNALAQRAGIASLGDRAYIQKTISYVREARGLLISDLRKICHLTVFDGQANFLLVKLHGSAGIGVAGLYARLLQRGIIIRPCEDFYGLDARFFRIAVRKKHENRRLVAELKTILGSARTPGRSGCRTLLSHND